MNNQVFVIVFVIFKGGKYERRNCTFLSNILFAISWILFTAKMLWCVLSSYFTMSGGSETVDLYIIENCVLFS